MLLDSGVVVSTDPAVVCHTSFRESHRPSGLKVSVLSLSAIQSRMLLIAGLAAVAGLALALRLPLLEAQPNYEEWLYLASALLIDQGFTPFSQVWNPQGPLFPILQMPLFSATGGDLSAARAAMLPFTLIGVLAGGWAGWLLGGRVGALIGSVIVAAEPIHLAVSRTFQSEGPAHSFALLGVALALSSWRTPGPVRPVLCGVALGLSLATKALAASACAPCGLLLLFGAKTPRERVTRVALAALAGAVTVAIPVITLGPALVWEQSVAYHILIKARLSVPLADNLQTVREALEPGSILLLVLAGLGLVAGGRRRDLAVASMAVWLACALVSVLAFQPLSERHLVVLTGPLACCAALLGRLSLGGAPRAAGYGALAGVLAVSVWGAAASERILVQLRSEPVRRGSDINLLRQLVQPTEFVLSDNGLLTFLAQRRIVPELTDTTANRIGTQQLPLPHVIEATQRWNASVALVTDRRLMRLTDFPEWLASEYTLGYVSGPSQFWVRRDRPDLARRAIAWRADAFNGVEFGNRLELFAYRAEETARGSTSPVYLGWRAGRAQPAGVTVELWAMREQEDASFSTPAVPLRSSSGPVGGWGSGSLHLSIVPLDVPRDQLQGRYRLYVRLRDAGGAIIPVRAERRDVPDGLLPLGRISI